MDRDAILILTLLDEEDHEEGDDGRASIDDKLPRVRIMEKRSRNYFLENLRENCS